MGFLGGGVVLEYRLRMVNVCSLIEKLPFSFTVSSLSNLEQVLIIIQVVLTVTFNYPCCFLDSNLKKAEETVSRLEIEIAENEKLMEELTEQLKKLEDQAGEIMKSCQEAEVPRVAVLMY